jgi:solute:Na+ symporter, SSS family
MTALFAAATALRLGVAEWAVLGLYAALMVGFAAHFARAGTKSADGFLIGERSLPWWVIGFANVATYSDSGGGWVWLFYVGGFMYLNQIAWIAWPIWMPLVGVFWAKMWRRSGLVTTGELIELRYSGRGAALFRGFYGVYACLAWATVFLGYGTAMLAQILAPLIGWTPLAVVLVFGAVTLAYTLMGGLLGAAYIDVPQFVIFFGAAFAIWFLGVQDHGSYAAMLDRAMAQRDASFWQVFPPSSGANTYVDPASLVALILIGFFLAGSPCAGEGWTAQRCLAAKDERHAVLGQMFNSILSLVIRMVPLLPLGVLAIASFPPADPPKNDAMILPDGTSAASIGVWSQLVVRYSGRIPGLGGLLVAAVLAGYMSTVGTLLQWGSSFVVNDLYRRHLRPDAPGREHIAFARWVMVGMMALATVLALGIDDIGPWVFFINAAMIAPALPLSWLRWFWWRLNVWGEVFGILISVPLSAFVWFGLDWKDPARPVWQPTLLLLGIGLAGSVAISLLTPAESRETLRRFYQRVRPPGAWGPIRRELEAEGLVDADQGRRGLRWDLAAAACGIAFCFAITWSFFAAVMLRWAESGALALLAGASGWAYYACWLRSYGISAEGPPGPPLPVGPAVARAAAPETGVAP